MPVVVPGGAIDTYLKANPSVLLTSETEEPDGTSAYVYTDKGRVVWTKEDGQTRLLPFE